MLYVNRVIAKTEGNLSAQAAQLVVQAITIKYFSNNNEAREARNAEFFFLVLQGKKVSSYRIAYTRVGCLERLSLFVCLCMLV